MKMCPYCAEEIQDDAVFCRHCKSELTSPLPQQSKYSAKPVNYKQILKWFGIVLLALLAIKIWYIVIPAGAIWYLWKKSKFNRRIKIVASATLLIVFSLLEGLIAYGGRTPTITVTEPQNGSSIQAQSVILKGKISPSKSTLVINGKNVEVGKGGLFTYEIKLTDEQNAINIKATNGKNIANSSISVKRIFTAEEKAELDRQKAEAEAKKQAELEAQKRAQAQADAKAKAEQAAYENSAAGKLCKAHPEWAEDDCTNLANRKIWIGMSYDMLTYLRGKPDSANPSNYGRGTEWQ